MLVLDGASANILPTGAVQQGFVAEDGSDAIYGARTVVRAKTRVFTAFSSGWTTAVGAVADVSGDVYRARLGDFRRPRIGASAGAALSERAPVAVQPRWMPREGEEAASCRVAFSTRSLALANNACLANTRPSIDGPRCTRGRVAVWTRDRVLSSSRSFVTAAYGGIGLDLAADRDQFNANEVHFSGCRELFIFSFSFSLAFFLFLLTLLPFLCAWMSPSPQPRTRFAPDCRWRTGKRSCYREGNQYLGPSGGRRGLAGTSGGEEERRKQR